MLKALILAAGLIGAGNWGQYARARDYERKIYFDFMRDHLLEHTRVKQKNNRNTK